VRGFLTRSSDDRFNSAVDVAKHVIVPESENQEAIGFQVHRPLSVLRGPLGVLPSVKLNDQTCGLATKIDDVRFDRHLPTEFQAIQPAVPQPKP
jgi:hypothetical protein